MLGIMRIVNLWTEGIERQLFLIDYEISSKVYVL
jgi:hypothetical protein